MMNNKTIQLYIKRAKNYGNKALVLFMTFVKNPDNQVIVAFLAIAIVLYLISNKENFRNTDYMYLKDKDEYLCSDLHFSKYKNEADKVKVIKNEDDTVNIQFNNKDKHYLGVNNKGDITSGPLSYNCSYNFVFQDNLIRLKNTGEYVSRRGDKLEVVRTKDKALRLMAE